MKRKNLLLLGGMVITPLVATFLQAQECQNKGYVSGWASCKAVDYCENHNSPQTCTTAQINWDIRNTGTVNGYYINLYNAPCTQDVDCYWDVHCSQRLNGGHDSHNGQFPDQEPC